MPPRPPHSPAARGDSPLPHPDSPALQGDFPLAQPDPPIAPENLAQPRFAAQTLPSKIIILFAPL
jgi:hypothetical protein